MPRGLKHRDHVTAFFTMDDALAAVRGALRSGDPSTADRRLDDAERVLEQHAPELSISEAARRLDVSEPTARAWAQRGLLKRNATKPLTVTAASVRALHGQLEQLREARLDKRRWAAVLHSARDRRELDLPGARNGLEEAQAAATQRRRARQRAVASR